MTIFIATPISHFETESNSFRNVFNRFLNPFNRFLFRLTLAYAPTDRRALGYPSTTLISIKRYIESHVNLRSHIATELDRNFNTHLRFGPSLN